MAACPKVGACKGALARMTALTIGNFDGVHRGHLALIHTARQTVGSGGRVVAATFEPHPAEVLRPGGPARGLSSPGQRRQWLEEAGVDDVRVLPTTLDLLNTEPEQFIRRLAQEVQPAWVVEGPDFRFGKGRSGSLSTLRALEGELGYRTIVVDEVEAVLRDQSIVRVSSSMIRTLLRLGRVEDAAILLGRPYALEATVVRGAQMGRTFDVPTANLDCPGYVLPADGVYGGTALMPDGASFAAAISVGNKPTFEGGHRLCEAHLLAFDGGENDYDWTIQLTFEQWLRDQLAFDDVDSLVRQMQCDIERARRSHVASGAAEACA